MLKNADCTIYENGGTETNISITAKHVVKDVYWYDSRGMTVTRNGAQISDAVIVYLYSFGYVPKAGDIIVRGECGFDFDSTSPQTMAASFRAFREQHPDFAVIKNALDARYGGLKHIELTAR